MWDATIYYVYYRINGCTPPSESIPQLDVAQIPTVAPVVDSFAAQHAPVMGIEHLATGILPLVTGVEPAIGSGRT